MKNDKNKTEFISINIFAKKYCGIGKPVSWIHSYPTARTWVKDDIAKNNILQVKINPANFKTGIRYYIPVKNIPKFVEAFNKNKLK